MGIGKTLITFVIGLSLIGYGGFMHLNQQSDVENAVTGEATVQNTGIEKIGGETSQNPTASYEPSVTYTYTYEGQEYTSDSVYPGAEKRFGTKEGARSVTNQYPHGQVVTVYINRDDPSRAFLVMEDSKTLREIGALAIGVLFLVGGINNLWKALTGTADSG